MKASEIPTRISNSKGHPLVLTVLRGPDTVQIRPVRPERIQGAYRLGSVLSGRGLSPPEAVWSSVTLTGSVSKQIVTSLTNLVHKKGRKDIDAVGIVQGSSTALSQGAMNFLWVLGLISLSLALLNLCAASARQRPHRVLDRRGVPRPPAPRGLRRRLGGRDHARAAPLLRRPVR